MKTILIIDDVHEILVHELQKAGYNVIYKPLSERNEILQLVHNIYGLVVRSKTPIDKELIDVATGLRFIARAGAGIDNIDCDYANTKNIMVFNAGEANADAVGEHTIGMLLSLFAKINKADAEVRELKWDREGNRGVELSGKTIGIIGYGNTGSAVAKKLRGFNMKILAYDKYLKNYGNEYVHECTLQEIFDATDIVTLHVPLTAETRQMVNEVFINSFNKPIYLLNLSRGEVIDTMHLIQAMQSNKVLGVALDVLENEKPASFNENEKTWMKYLTQSNKTVLTPHIAGWTKESYFKISEVLLRKVLALS